MFNIAIVDDDSTIQEELNHFIIEYSNDKKSEMNIKTFSCAEDFLSYNDSTFDIIFMDIELGKLNGMDAIKQFRQTGHDNLVIFVSYLQHYAIDGYSVNAFDFIVKPLNYYDFKLKMDRAIEKLSISKSKELVISTKGEKVIINTDDLIYVEVERHSLIYHLKQKSYRTTGSMKKAIEDVKGLNFSLCNQCYLINLSYVTKLSRNEVFVNGIPLIISLPRRKQFESDLLSYLKSANSLK